MIKNTTIILLSIVSVFGLISFTQMNGANDKPQNKPEFKIITAVESIIPQGFGRSRIIESLDTADLNTATPYRLNGTDSDQDAVNRSDLKVSKFKETKLMNLYSVAGINFQNIASNDAMISEKISSLMEDGWELMTIVGSVEGQIGKQNGKGIFMTRYYFKR